MSVTNLTQVNQEESQELVELNNDDLDIVVGGQGNQNLRIQKTQTRSIKSHEIDKFTKSTNNGYEVGTRDISFDSLETVTSYM